MLELVSPQLIGACYTPGSLHIDHAAAMNRTYATEIFVLQYPISTKLLQLNIF